MVPIGLILLSALAILTFFGVTERFFRKVGIPDWLAFLLVLSFVIGAVVPEIPIGTRVTLNVGGFIIPAVFIIILFSVAPAKYRHTQVALLVCNILYGFKYSPSVTIFTAPAKPKELSKNKLTIYDLNDIIFLSNKTG